MDSRNFRYGLTFDDLILVPERSEILPDQVDVTTKLSKKIIQYTVDKCRHGYGYRIRHGDNNGETGRYRLYSQKHEY